MNLRQIRQGDIYYADLAPAIGSEQGGNRYSPTIIAAIITGQIKSKYLPTHVLLTAPDCSLPQNSMVMPEQLRTLDKLRLHHYIGSLSKRKMDEIDAALEISIGLAELAERNSVHDT